MRNRFLQRPVSASPVNQIVEQLQALSISDNVTPALAGSLVSLESVDNNQFLALQSAHAQMTTALESVSAQLGFEGISSAQRDAGAMAGLLAGDFRRHLTKKLQFAQESTQEVGVVQPMGIPDAMMDRAFALEAYDERENRNAVIYSIAYNMQSARQDEFGETFFPTIVVTPDNVGFGITVNLMLVYDGIERKITADFQDFRKKNIIRAVADPTVLRKELTRLVPVVRPQNAGKFVDPADVAVSTVVVEDQSLQTAPIAFGIKEFDLLALCTSDALLASGTQDQTDTIDPAISLTNVYLKVGDDVIRVNTRNLPLSNFTYSTQNNYRVQSLNFTTSSALLNKDTVQADGSALVDTLDIVTGDYIVRLQLQVSGSVNIETGSCNLFANSISVYSVQDANGNQLDMTAGAVTTLVALLESGELIGYDLEAFRTNANVRQRGQLIDVTRYTQLYNVPLRSPISTIHPITVDAAVDSSDVEALITATRIRTSNEAVTALIQTAELLSDYVDARDFSGEGPEVLGVGRFFVRPTFFTDSVDMMTAIDSVKSHERAEDIQAVLVNKVRDFAYRMYRDSEYKAAADALAGGVAPVPTVIIGTDPVLARYLNVTGDLRTLGGEFDVRIVSTLDHRVQGKIFVTFGVFTGDRNSAPNPLNFGNLAWAPELVLTANISRQGQISKETVVQPRYLFVTNLPVLTAIEVSNVPDVLNKVPLNFHSV
jgi:hypothetical protein